ncbi:MAG TPA: PHB depolymerase family esterase [Thermoleophilaceae bacterium]|jgi:polyhydroxybutyrate depolymerase
MRAVGYPCAVAALGLLALLSSCSGGASKSRTVAAAPTSSACTGQGTRQRSFTFVLESGGRKRSALVYVPPHAGRARLPLLLVFHFAGGPARAMELSTGLSGLASRKRFIAVYPNAAPPNHFWNISSAGSRADDVGFVRDLLANLGAQVCFDPARVYATGLSNGGGMAARVGCDLSDEIAAVAPVSGGYSTLPKCTRPQRASLLEIHGTGDPVVPYTGRGPSHAGDVMTFVRGWAAADGCGATPARTRPAKDAVRFDWPGCRSGTHVAHVRLLGFGHGWPGAPGPVFRGKDSSFPANAAIWRFLSAQRLAAP